MEEKCPECNRELVEHSQTLDENNILREQYGCLNGHVWEKLGWFPVPKYAKLTFPGREE
jgi:hypothetical protein